MDIFFCDLCGVRVTDADLRSGQGQRSHWDVICPSCLEQGLGKEWLGKRASGRQKAVGARADAGDRIATMEDDHDNIESDVIALVKPVAAAPAIVAAADNKKFDFTKTVDEDAPIPAPNFDDLDDEPSVVTANDHVEADAEDDADEDDDNSDLIQTTEGAPRQVEAVSPTSKMSMVSGSNGQLAMAASAFSALGKKSAEAAVDEDDGDLHDDRSESDDDDDDLVDRAYATPAEQLSPALGSSALAEGESPFAVEAGVHLEKSETALVPALPGVDEAPLELDDVDQKKSAGKKSGGTSARRKSAAGKGASTSSRIVKSGKNGKTSRAARAKGGKDASKVILFASIGALILIAIGFVAVIGSKSMRGGTSGPQVTSTEAIRSTLKSANEKAIKSLQSQDLNEMKSALSGLKAAQGEVMSFEDRMKKDGNSQEQIDAFLASMHLSDIMMLVRSLNDQISAQKMR